MYGTAHIKSRNLNRKDVDSSLSKNYAPITI